MQSISIHAPLAGCDARVAARRGLWILISIHAPLAGCDTTQRRVTQCPAGISIHAPLAGCDVQRQYQHQPALHFNPRTPCGVRRVSGQRPLYRSCISIHAPLAGCDVYNALDFRLLDVFQSTHPLRGATCRHAGCGVWWLHFNPRTPCGVRRATVKAYDSATVFQSTHPLRGATRGRTSWSGWGTFQSTHPLRGATTRSCQTPIPSISISIHAPLAGCDICISAACWLERISIHAPLAGCDDAEFDALCCPPDFNPRTPCGVRHPAAPAQKAAADFNPRTPCGVRRALPAR